MFNITPSDFTVRVENLPPNVSDNELIEFFEFQYIGERMEILSINRAYKIEEFHEY